MGACGCRGSKHNDLLAIYQVSNSGHNGRPECDEYYKVYCYLEKLVVFNTAIGKLADLQQGVINLESVKAYYELRKNEESLPAKFLSEFPEMPIFPDGCDFKFLLTPNKDSPPPTVSSGDSDDASLNDVGASESNSTPTYVINSQEEAEEEERYRMLTGAERYFEDYKRDLKHKIPTSSFIELGFENLVKYKNLVSDLKNEQGKQAEIFLREILWLAMNEALFLHIDSDKKAEEGMGFIDKDMLEKYLSVMVKHMDRDQEQSKFQEAWAEMSEGNGESPYVARIAFLRTDTLATLYFNDLFKLRDDWGIDTFTHNMPRETPHPNTPTMLPILDIAWLYHVTLVTLTLEGACDKTDIIALSSCNLFLSRFIQGLEPYNMREIYDRVKKGLLGLEEDDDSSHKRDTQMIVGHTTVDFLTLLIAGVYHVMDQAESVWGLFLEASFHNALFNCIAGHPLDALKMRANIAAVMGPSPDGANQEAGPDGANQEAVPIQEDIPIVEEPVITYAKLEEWCDKYSFPKNEAKKRILALDRYFKTAEGKKKLSDDPEAYKSGKITFKDFVNARTPKLFPESFNTVAANSKALGLRKLLPMRLIGSYSKTVCKRKSTSESGKNSGLMMFACIQGDWQPTEVSGPSLKISERKFTFVDNNVAQEPIFFKISRTEYSENVNLAMVQLERKDTEVPSTKFLLVSIECEDNTPLARNKDLKLKLFDEFDTEEEAQKIRDKLKNSPETTPNYKEYHRVVKPAADGVGAGGDFP